MKSEASEKSFGFLPEELCGYEKAKVAILPVPYEGTTTYGKGTAKAPAAIIHASQNMELYEFELGTIASCGIATLKELKPEKSPEEMVDSVEKVTGSLLNDNKFPVILGGEHSITTGAVKAMKKKYPDISVLQLDAHSDLRDTYENSKYSHACVMSRVAEVCGFAGAGIRSMDTEEAETIKKNHYTEVYAWELIKKPAAIQRALDSLTDTVYITLDIDVLDPSIMQSTGTPEPGGLGWYQINDLLRTACAKKKVVGFDLVELAPMKGMPAPDFTAARLAYRLVGMAQK